MNQKKKIIKALREGEERPTVTVSSVEDAKRAVDSVGDKANVKVEPIVEMEDNTDEGLSKYLSDIKGEQPFDIKGNKYIKVNAKHSDGSRGIGFYDFAHEKVYNDVWFIRNIAKSDKEYPMGSAEPEDYERASRGVEYGTGDIYENTNPKMTKGELQEMITGKKQPKIIKTVKVKNIK